MKKLAIMMCTACILAGSGGIAAETTGAPNEGIKNPPSKEEIMNRRKAHEAAFEQKLGLTEAQKIKARELRIQGRQKMKPVLEENKAKKQEARMVKMSRIAVQMQEEKLAQIDKELAVLEKKANEIRKQNMKDFEAILTKDQKKILKNMKKEGRKNFERGHHCPPPPPCPEQMTPPSVSK